LAAHDLCKGVIGGGRGAGGEGGRLWIRVAPPTPTPLPPPLRHCNSRVLTTPGGGGRNSHPTVLPCELHRSFASIVTVGMGGPRRALGFQRRMPTSYPASSGRSWSILPSLSVRSCPTE